MNMMASETGRLSARISCTVLKKLFFFQNCVREMQISVALAAPQEILGTHGVCRHSFWNILWFSAGRFGTNRERNQKFDRSSQNAHSSSNPSHCIDRSLCTQHFVVANALTSRVHNTTSCCNSFTLKPWSGHWEECVRWIFAICRNVDSFRTKCCVALVYEFNFCLSSYVHIAYVAPYFFFRRQECNPSVLYHGMGFGRTLRCSNRLCVALILVYPRLLLAEVAYKVLSRPLAGCICMANVRFDTMNCIRENSLTAFDALMQRKLVDGGQIV